MNINKSSDNRKTAKSAALAFIDYKDRTEKEVREKLVSLNEFDGADIEEAIETLKRGKIIDDIRYAETFISVKARNLDGRNKVMFALKHKGVVISDGEYDKIKASLEAALEEENAAVLIKRKLRNDVSEENVALNKKKITNYLIGKGYTHHEINGAFKLLEENQ